MKTGIKSKILAVVVLLTLVFAACGIGGGGGGGGAPAGPAPAAPAAPAPAPATVTPAEVGTDPVELVVSWWGGAARHERTLEMIDLYTEANPHVTIAPIFAAFGDYWPQLATMAAAGNLPDVMLIQLMYLGEYTHRGFIRDLNPMVNAGHIDVSNFTSGALSASSVHGALMGITMGDTSSVLVYNRSLIERVGGTMPRGQMLNSEFAAYLKALVPLMPPGYFVAERWDQGEQFMENFMRQHGVYGLTTEAGGEIGFTREMLAAWFEFNLELFEAGVFGSMEEILDDRGVPFGDSLRGRGHQAFWGTNANQTKIFQATLDDTLGMVRVPVADGYVRRHAEVAVPSTWTISSNTPNPYDAAHFINAMVNDWDLQYIYNMDIGVPGSTVIQANLVAGLDTTDPVDAMIEREIEIMQDILNSIDPFHGRPEGYPIIVNSLQNLMDEVMAGNMTVDQAVDQHFSSMAMLLG